MKKLDGFMLFFNFTSVVCFVSATAMSVIIYGSIVSNDPSITCWAFLIPTAFYFLSWFSGMSGYEYYIENIKEK